MMKLRAPTDVFAASLLAAIGLFPSAGCSGKTFDDDGPEASGGTTSTGGSGTSGSGTSGSTSRGGTGTGGGVAGGTSGGSGPTGGTGPTPYPCNNPMALDGGYLVCDNGVVVREEAAECDSALPRPDPVPDYDPAQGECQYDTECVDAPHGYCTTSPFIGPGYSFCAYGCVADDQCGPGAICVCAGPVGHCVQSNCTTSDDCQPGTHCASYDPSPGCDGEAFACQTASDQCASDADCGTSICTVDAQTGARYCSQAGCAIGRPFLVDEVARVAPIAQRGDWVDADVSPDRSRVTPELASELCAEWTRAAQLEHASIAAFSRFLLELMAFGAPSELLAETVRAIEDERRHARLCFGLASAFAGEQVGPGRLDVSGALPAPSLARSLATALVEGCIGETVAALEASELAAQVVDPVLRDALEGIAADERRHAELAWKFAHWAVSRDHSLSALLEQELERVQRELFEFNPPQAKPGDRDRAQAGVMPGAMRTAVRREALRRIVEPGLSGMIDHARARSAA